MNERFYKIAAIGVIACFVLAVIYVVVRLSDVPPRDISGAERIIPAAHAYAKLLKKQGTPVPTFVNAKELVRKGLLKQGDLSAFTAMEVNVSTAPDDSHPGEVLVRARRVDGTELVLLADGSVHDARHR